MCGRFTQHWTWAQLRAASEPFWEVPDFGEDPTPRYNLAPTQDALVIRAGDVGPVIDPVRWGYEKPGAAGEVINARAETAAVLPMFRESAARRRCLVPASGFYEWDRCGDGSKQPWHLAADTPIFFLAALWRDTTRGPRFVTLTFPTPEGFEPAIHHRMPGVVPPGHAAAWLDPNGTDAAEALTLAAPFGDPEACTARAWPVSTRVNSARSDGESLLDRVEPPAGLFG